MKRFLIISLSLLLSASPLFAQQKDNTPKKKKVSTEQRSLNRQGNSQYKKEAYAEAEASYRKALREDSTYYRSLYNLGNSLYQQKNYSEAAKQFDRVASNAALDAKDRSKAYHNLGNSHLQQGLQQKQGGAQDGGRQMFQQAVNDYQQALRLDPKNQDTKYNLSYAKKMLLQAQQNQQNNQNQQQQQQQPQQGQEKEKEKESDNQQQQNQQQQQNHNKDQRQQEQQRKQDQQNKDQKKKEAEQILKAVKNNEKNTLKDQQKQKESKVDSRIDRDW